MCMMSVAAPDFDPRAAAKTERKARSLKVRAAPFYSIRLLTARQNESQRLRNEANATAASAKKAATGKALAPTPLTDVQRQSRKSAVERDLLSTRKSTASLGRYDKSLAGEEAVLGKRPRGEKRKFDANELPGPDERDRGLKLLKTLGTGGGSGGRRTDGDTAPLVNARKAIRSASGGRGAAALAGRGGSKRGRGGRGGNRGGRR
jgi:regulator of ribosome biosynthesis